jgi:hypothetical protein
VIGLVDHIISGGMNEGGVLVFCDRNRLFEPKGGTYLLDVLNYE